MHDLEHLLTGYPTGVPGEMGLYVANMVSTYDYFQPPLAKEIALISSFLFSTWTMRISLHHPEAMPAVCDAMEKGTILGKRLKRPFFMERWEEYLDWPLPDLRARFDIPEPERFVGDWAWLEPQDVPVAE